ncbi:MAG: glycosyltransferase family 2 protein [Microcystaceae cyanobacterium]
MNESSCQSPKVSVLMVTYNHVNFIAQAIESVLMQKTDFDYELVIGEDCSIDGTREIVKGYANKYSDKIHILFHKSNLGYGGRLNLLNTLGACNGKYVAFLEGDDYWKNPLKLQKQVDFLEKHSDYVGAFHDTEIIAEENKSEEIQFWQNWQDKLDCSLEDTVSWTPPFHTSSFLVKSKCLENLPQGFLKFNSADIALYIISASQGLLRRIPETMSAYRRHDGGITKTASQQGILFYSSRIYLFRYLKKFLNGQASQKFDEVIAWYKNIVYLVWKDEQKSLKDYLKGLIIMSKNCGIKITSDILRRFAHDQVHHSILPKVKSFTKQLLKIKNIEDTHS